MIFHTRLRILYQLLNTEETSIKTKKELQANSLVIIFTFLLVAELIHHRATSWHIRKLSLVKRFTIVTPALLPGVFDVSHPELVSTQRVMVFHGFVVHVGHTEVGVSKMCYLKQKGAITIMSLNIISVIIYPLHPFARAHMRTHTH